MEPEIIIWGAIDMQVCVPSDWTDKQVKDFADSNNPSGTTHGWSIRRQGDKALTGDNERVECSTKNCFVHIMLDA